MTEQLAPTTHGAAGGIPDELVERAVARADQWARAGAVGAATGPSAQLAALMHDPAGVDFTLRFVDRVARPADDHVAARELARLAGPDAPLPDFIGGADRAMLRAGARLAPRAPRVVVPLARRRLRALVGHLIVDADGRGLERRLEEARAEGFRLNLNLLGEAVLGEEEADRRLARTMDLLRRGDVDYVSVKASSVASQLVPWDLEGSRDRLVERLTPLFRLARETGSFVNLDMEEYKDLDLTVALFTTLLDRPEFTGLRGRDRAAGLPPRRPRRAGGAGRVRPPPGRGRWRADQGPAGQGREPRDGEGRRRGARLAAGAVHDEGRGRRELRAPARPGDRGRPRRRAAPRRREPPPPPRRAGRRARRRPRRRAPDRRRDAAGHGAGAGEGGGARRPGAARALHAGGARRRLRRRRLVPRAPARGERVAGELPLRAVLRRRARLVHRPIPGLGARPRRGAGDAEALRARE